MPSDEMSTILRKMFDSQVNIEAGVELITYEIGDTLSPIKESSNNSEIFLQEISKTLGIMTTGVESISKVLSKAPKGSVGGGVGGFEMPSVINIIKTMTFSVFPSVIKAYAKGMRKVVKELSKVDEVSVEKLKAFNEASNAMVGFSKIKWTSVLKGSAATKILSISIKNFIASMETTSDVVITRLGELAKSIKIFNDVNFSSLMKFGIAMKFLKNPLGDFVEAVRGINADGFEKTCKSIGKGIDSIGKADVTSLTKIGNTILKIGGGMIVFAGGIYALGKALTVFSDVKVEDIAKATVVVGGLVAAAYGLSKMEGSLFKSALGLAAMGGSLALVALSLRIFESLDWETVGKATIVLGGLALLGTFMGKSMATIAEGALAIALLGASLIPLAFGLNLLEGISWKALGIAAVALVGLTLAAAGLGALLMGPQAALFVAGVAAIAALGAALIPLAYGLNLLSKVDMKAFDGLTGMAWSLTKASGMLLMSAPGMILAGAAMLPLSVGIGALRLAIGDGSNNVGKFFDGFTDKMKKLSDSNLIGIAAGIAAIGAAIAGFGVGEAAAGLANFVGKLLSFGADSPLDQLMRLSEEGYNLIGIGQSIKAMAEGMKSISDLDTDWASFSSFPWEKIKELKDFKAPIQIIASANSAAVEGSVKSLSSAVADTVSPINTSNVGGGTTVINNVSRGGDVHNVSNSNVNQNVNGAAGPILTGSAMGLYAF